MAKTSGLLFDAATVGGLMELSLTSSARARATAPEPAPGEIVVYYGGWSLVQIALSAVGMQHFYHSDWTDDYDWKSEAGYYRLIIPAAIHGMTWREQCASLPPGWSPSPVCVALTACIAHVATTGSHLITGRFCRCAEPLRTVGHVGLLLWSDALLGVDGFWDESRGFGLSMAAVQKVC